MRTLLSLLVPTVIAVVFPAQSALALGQPSFVSFAPAPGHLLLSHGGNTAPLFVDAEDHPGVVRAARDLQADIERVTGREPELLSDRRPTAETVVIIGTLGRNSLIDSLVSAAKIDDEATLRTAPTAPSRPPECLRE